MYDIILFDLDDTLLDFKLSQARSLKLIHEHYFPNVSYLHFEKKFMQINYALWERVGATSNPLQPNEVGKLRFSLLNEALQHAHDTDLLANTYEESLGQTTTWLPGAEEVVQFLHQEGKTLGLITNGISQTQRTKLKRHRLERWFSTLLISDELGISKPERKIFDIALEQITQKIGNATLDKVLMVGDSLTSDGHGAHNANINFCLVGELTSKKKKQPPIHHHIQSVQELPKILNLETQFHRYLHR